MLKKERAAYVLRRLEELYPETPVPLDHSNPFTLLIAVLLSAQCTDVRVNLVTPALFAKADNAEVMKRLSVAEIDAIVRPCGLAPRKATAIRDLSEILVKQKILDVFKGKSIRNSFCSEILFSSENPVLLLVKNPFRQENR